MVRSSQRTLYCNDIQLHSLFGKPYQPLENTTLNEKFSVLPNQIPTAGTYPTLKYLAIGCGGSVIIDNVNTYDYNEHLPVDGALFKHIPFVIRKATEDLTVTERQGYRMRALVNINGSMYACYYLKVITDYELKPIFNIIRTMESGVTINSPTLSIMDMTKSTILNPEPVNRKLTFDNMNTLDYSTKIAKINITLSARELEEIKNSIDLMRFPNSNITEIGLVTGVDVPNGGATEVIASQIAIHISVNIDIAAAMARGTSLQKAIEIGGGEPLIN